MGGSKKKKYGQRFETETLGSGSAKTLDWGTQEKKSEAVGLK